ncbi:2-hydroxyacid dehydrogenase [Marinovum sp. 2_MG-2023]|uniref:2-hydroxyacid dehydrogenase n=1 Tax=Roseobacteraceae TaxID=2854170 RepID=UPI001FD2A091|nr:MULTISPECIES: 2-hydroxyacid dehydrogenase [Roseobacteraceae]MCJ7871420.1 2-hydroxyacid dehydrogenase [Phaeobacter sp. J2-8]MDO6732784.1 2-hydroxyacid dehydrogenase [Marinovum sp. 2_MG-2023]MDO6781876.1 2-hydroxyacid dehydrogenase [Marinovum sp. 1_MG-2023]
MSKVLAIGPYSASEAEAHGAALECVFLDGPDAVSGLDQATRDGVVAVAYKGHHPFGAAEMDLLPNLGVVANYGVGYDAIDVVAADARDIKVTNTPGVLNDDVADLAVAMWLMQGREMEQASAWARDGKWAGESPYRLNRKVSGAKVGVVGLGRIGREIADRLAAFKTEIHYHARSEKETPGWTYHADVVSLAGAVDFLFIALVGGPETENYVSKEAIAALGPRGVIVNISRGSTVDEGAMLDALEAGELAGAGLDVFLNEPDIDKRFYDLPNVVIQPHQGSGTHETRAAMAQLQRDNVSAFLAGEALKTPVN